MSGTAGGRAAKARISSGTRLKPMKRPTNASTVAASSVPSSRSRSASVYATLPGGPVSVQPRGSSTSTRRKTARRVPGGRGLGRNRWMSTPLGMAVTAPGSTRSVEIAVSRLSEETVMM